MNNIFPTALSSLKERLTGIEVSSSTIITVLRFAMEVVEATELKGAAQKQLCNKLVRQIVVDAPIADQNEQLLLNMLDRGILESTMDLIVDATKGRLDINQILKVGEGCCLPLLGRFKV